ncbi:restriction endonuclease subunit S [Vibrio vulnificus]|nr:restriction endonuclease subunit S [Vibrio vulnificus]
MTTLGEYAKVQGGFAYKSKDFIGASEYRVLKIKNVRFGTIDYSEPAFVPKNIAESTINWKLKEGDILISMTGSGPNAPQSLVGRVARVWKNEPDAWFNQRVGRISLVDNKKIHPDFIFYWLSLPQNQDFLVANSSGSANQANISGKTIESLPTPIVDYEISSAIAKIARELDEKIILNTQTNQTLEHIAQAIFKSWFVDFDPVKAKMETLAAGGSADDAELAAMSVISAKTVDELNSLKASNPEAFNKLAQTATLFPAAMQDSELGEIPEGWNIKPIKGFGKVITGKTPPHKVENAYNEQGVSFITPTDIDSDIFVTETKRFLSESGVEVVKKNLLPAGSICVTCIGSQMGKTVITPSVSISNQQINSIVVAKEYQRNFLFLNLRRRREEIFLIGSSGSTMPIINKSTFEKLLVLAPTDTLFKAFDETVSSLLNKIHKNALENQTLTALRDTLLPKLLSGEIDLTSEVVE